MSTRILALIALFLAGCAPSNAALRSHSTAAQTLDELAAGAKATLLELRQADLDRAAFAARDAGAPVEPAVRVAAVRFDAGPALGAVNAFIAAKDLYVRAVLLAASKDKPTWSAALPMLRDVIAAYNAMRAALGSPPKMPPVPSAIAALLVMTEPPIRRPCRLEIDTLVAMRPMASGNPIGAVS